MSWWNPVDWAKSAWKHTKGVRDVGGAVVKQTMHYTGLEQLAAGDHWLYSHAVARPISTAEQVLGNTGLGALQNDLSSGGIADMIRGKNPIGRDLLHVRQQAQNGAWGDVFKAQTWGKAWKRSAYISPGQAATISGVGGSDQFQRASGGWLKDQGGKWAHDGNVDLDDPASVNRFFSHGPQKLSSGLVDFTTSWFGDPLVVGGKALKVTKAASSFEHLLANNERGLVKSTGELRLANPAEKDIARQQTFGQMEGRRGAFTRIIRATEGKSANQILQFNFARRSTNGPLLAHLLANAADEAEKRQVLRLSLGDQTAFQELKNSNHMVAEQVRYATDRWSSIGHNMENLTPNTPAWEIAKQRMQDYSDQLGAIDQEYNLFASKMKVYNTSDGLNYGLGSRFGAHVRGVRHDVVQSSIYDRPLMIARSLSRKAPNGMIDLNDPGSIAELEAQLEHAGKTRFIGRYKGAITPEMRDKMLSDYAAASDKSARARVAAGIEKTVADKIAEKYGFSRSEGDRIYAAFAAKRQQVVDKTMRFSAGKYTDETGHSVPIDQFMDDGSALVTNPVLRSQIQRSHLFLDMENYDRALRMQGGALKATMRAGWGAAKTADAMARTLQQYWKIGVFLRLGFPIRNVSDELLSQTARFGVGAMLNRTIDGGERIMRGLVQKSGAMMHGSVKEMHEAHVADLEESKKLLEEEAHRILRLGEPEAPLSPTDQAKLQAVMVQHDIAQQAIADAKATLADLPNHKLGETPFTVDVNGIRIKVPGAFQGDEGNLYRSMASSDNNMQGLLGVMNERTHELLRAGSWEVISPGVDEARHLTFWHHNITKQLAGDEFAKQAIAGKPVEEMASWLIKTPEGRKYYRDLNLKHQPSLDLAKRVKAEVEHSMPEEYFTPAIREKILQGAFTPDDLDSIMPKQYRPDVHAGRTDYNMGKGFLAQKTDRMITGFYKWMSALPTDLLSHNPLFAQQYEAHATRMVGRATAHLSPEDMADIASKARAFALRDMRRYTADMMHKSNAAQALGVISPFFNATQEAFTRWARVIRDEPGTVGRIGYAFGAPARAGLVTDQYGNKVDAEGYAIDPATGKRHMVAQHDRYITLGKNVVPWLKKGEKIAISQESANFVFQGQPTGNPGAGPIVQVALNKFAQDKPGVADILQRTGVLPYGINNKGVFDQVMPPVFKNLKDALLSDESDEDYQRIYLGVLQGEYAKHAAGWRPTPANLAEIRHRVRTQFSYRALAKSVLPFSAEFQPKGQYLTNEYRRLMAEDASTADEKFYEKYGDAAFVYTAKMSKSNWGVPTTKEGFAAYKKYKDVIEAHPELAGLIIGNEGNGDFSLNAYHAELAATIQGKPIREKQTAADAIADANSRRGWLMYDKYMKQLKVELTNRGLTDWADAPDLEAMKKAIPKVMGNPESSFYNKDWAKEYDTFDTHKYDRMIPDLKKIAADPELDHRTDIQTLRRYLEGRDAVQAALKQRAVDSGEVYKSGPKAGFPKPGSGALDSKGNEDLAQAWSAYVGALTEQDLDFESLYNRYLHRDMGVDALGGD